MSDTFNAIGKATPLVDGQAKVTGSIRYTGDLQLPDVLHARFVASPYAHARIQSIDTQAALNVPGVVRVLTAADMPDIPPSDRSRLLLARDRVIFAGQPVALVLAETEEAASDGVEQVSVDYEPLPAAMTVEGAMAEGAPLVWPDGLPNQSTEGRRSNTLKEHVNKRGDIQAGFAEADVIVERVFTSPMVHQSPIETQAVLVQPNLVTGEMTIWASTQAPFEVRQTVAEILDLRDSDVRVTAMPIGGGFGSKAGLYEPLAALAAQITRRPVRLVLTRLEEIAAGNPAPPISIRTRMGATKDGHLTALEATIQLDIGCYPSGWLAPFAGFMTCYSYRIPNYHIASSEILTFKQSGGAYRAPCGPTTAFAIETMLDELARALNMDPLELRLRNQIQEGDLSPSNEPWPKIGMREVLDTLRNHPAWQNREQARAQGRGVGIAMGGWPGGFEPAAAVCSVSRDGMVQVNIGSADISGTATSFTLMAAEVFGVAPENVKVVISDTLSAPYSGMAAGSKTTFSTGPAVIKAAQEARQQALAIAAEEFEVAVEDLEIVDGKIQVKGFPARTIKLAEIAAKTVGFGAKYSPVIAQGRYAQIASAPTFNVQLAEVEVDRETGDVRVHKLVVIQDVGRAINPLAIQGQLQGGATQGIGWALLEKMRYDESGQLLTGTWMDYAMPHSTQAAEQMEVILVEVPSETGPFGARGVGEAPVVPTAAAIANAIADATGVRMSNLPMSAPAVLEALHTSS
jgi:CO/xanthine dehydrogenase Mo-binding subunit